jgi:hypothetical protein
MVSRKKDRLGLVDGAYQFCLLNLNVEPNTYESSNQLFPV